VLVDVEDVVWIVVDVDDVVWIVDVSDVIVIVEGDDIDVTLVVFG
jgi:hypothetical protein